MKRYAACTAYMLLIYGFIFLPVIVLVLFSFQDGRFPVPPLKGLTLKWHAEVLADEDLRAALLHSLVVAVGSSLVALVFGFLAARALAEKRPVFRLSLERLERLACNGRHPIQEKMDLSCFALTQV